MFRLSTSRALVIISKRTMASEVSKSTKIKLTNSNSVGVGQNERRDKYLNPLITPPPRSPSSPDDFINPDRLGHWRSFGFNYTNPMIDRYKLNETVFFLALSLVGWIVIYCYSPDFKMSDWAKREAFLRTAKREALGLPLIDVDVVDPKRIILPTEEEIGDFPIMG